MADSVIVNNFSLPLATNSGWRCTNGSSSKVGNWEVSRWGEIWYKGLSVANDSDYGMAVYTNAVALTDIEDYQTEAAAEVLLLGP